MSAQNTSQPSDIQALAGHVASAASTPLARLVPSASHDSDRGIDEWVEREQRRGRSSINTGLALLGIVALAVTTLVLVA